MSTSSSGWSRLRWPIKAIIIALPLIGLGYLATEKGLFNSKTESFQDNDTATVAKPVAKESPEQKETTAKTSGGDLRTFNYQPEKPVDGELKGIVEVGATGFNSFVINFNSEKNGAIQGRRQRLRATHPAEAA